MAGRAASSAADRMRVRVSNSSAWREIGDRAWIGRFGFLDQTIGVIAGAERALVIDTRTTGGHGAEILAGLRRLTNLPHVVANTHHHWDHTGGNPAFRPCEIWGHERCVTALLASAAAMRSRVAAAWPDLADDLAATPVDPPDHTFDSAADLDLGGRIVALRHPGRGHTDNDVALFVGDADLVFAGDLIEQGAPPSCDDAYPLEWPATLGHLLDRAGESTVFVPGHGEPVDADFVRGQLTELAFVAETARRNAGADASALASDVGRHLGWPAAMAKVALGRALGQVRGEIA